MIRHPSPQESSEKDLYNHYIEIIIIIIIEVILKQWKAHKSKLGLKEKLRMALK